MRSINARRRDHNRLGFMREVAGVAVSGRPLQPNEKPPANLLHFVVEQLGADASEMGDYAARDETRREHLQVLCKEYRFRPYGSAHSPLLRRYLETEAPSIDSAFTLVESAMEWLRQHRVIPPALATLEAVVRAVRSKVERARVLALIQPPGGGTRRSELNHLLELARISHRIFYTSEGSEGKGLMTRGIGGRRWPNAEKQSVNGTNWRMAGSDSFFACFAKTSATRFATDAPSSPGWS